jgi:hypothetical protein
VELPAGTDDRHAWLSAHLLPPYRAIVANLLLSRAAAGEGRDDILALARGGDSDAVRALAHWPKADEALIGDLLALRDRPAQARNAADALAMLARRVGLPDVAELERRHLWATAWRREVLGHDRVRTDWPCDPYQLRLSVTRDGTARLEALGPEGPLVRPPADLRATDAYREARAVQREVEAQLRRFRAFLERAMVEQCPIAVDEWRYLLANPAFAWLAERLVWHSGGGDTFLWTAPERWECLGGMAMPVEALPGHMSLVVAHPAALAPDVLVGWQAIAAARPLKQPFRQLFREVYLPHIGDGPMCGRFVGRQVAPSAAYALLRTTGFAPGSGEATRAWPGGVTAHFRWAVDVTGRELFGRHARAAANTGDIWFTRGGLTLTAGEVDGVLYSETLRVADLVTARAGVGEGDLTSAETLAVRAAILREVACALGCTGILAPEGERHAVILGTRATYRLSLANGAVFLEPEGRQMVLPHASSDEDEDGTAAIIATALLLADDASITDPYFLGQLPADQSVAGSTKV